jgi:hypothetical protein
MYNNRMNQIFLWHKSCVSASQAGFPPCTENRLCGRYIERKNSNLLPCLFTNYINGGTNEFKDAIKPEYG